MPQQTEQYLIIALSARALAASARMANITVEIIDGFADADTVEYSKHLGKVAINKGSIDIPSLEKILDQIPEKDYSGVIIGSGLENNPEIMERIKLIGPIIGNSIETVRRCKQPELLVNILENLTIKYPKILLTKTVPAGDWLAKRIAANGGWHVERALPGNNIQNGCYLQERITGKSCSVTILADGVATNILGTNHNLVVNSSMNDYRYAGAISNPEYLAGDEEYIADMTDKIVQEFGLIGLCGIDFIKSDSGEFYLLEINPRPTATFELHQYNASLLEMHIKSCLGFRQDIRNSSIKYKGHRIIYAGSSINIPQITWPKWVTDRPVTGTQISSNQPFCSIHAQADTYAGVDELMKLRKQRLAELLGTHKIAA